MEVRVRFEVEQNYRGWRLDAYLANKVRRLTPEKVAFLIAHRLEHDEPGALTAETLVTPGLRFALVREVQPEPETPLHTAPVRLKVTTRLIWPIGSSRSCACGGA